ncbi:WD repeat-containing protein 31-like isoform X2 [Tachypleus tridentatus]|uniref:WD repeat-containing protein 31-like isoform X2 n=1 Tax=Tachypleus tridentatus TaxID=6853 RepID=UPI003FD5242C
MFLPADVFVATSHQEIFMWDSRTLELCSILGKKMHIQSSCSVSSDSNFCITTSAGFSSEGCEVTLWDLRERRLLEEFRQHEQAVMAATFLPLKPELSKSSHFVSGSKDGMICLWNKDKIGCHDSCLLMGSGSVTSLDVTADEHRLLIGTRQRGVLGLEINSNYRLLSCAEPTKF